MDGALAQLGGHTPGFVADHAVSRDRRRLLVVNGLATLGVYPYDSPIVAVGFVVFLVGLLLQLVRPEWWGPRWYRERDRDAGPNLRDPLTALAYAGGAARSLAICSRSTPTHPSRCSGRCRELEQQLDQR